MTKIQKVDLNEAYEGSYYTIEGAGGDLQEWVDGLSNILKEKGIGTPKKWFTCKGTDVNSYFELRGDEAFPRDLTFLFFPLDGLNVGKLAIFKLQMEDRWFDDIIDNSLRRLGKKYNSRTGEVVPDDDYDEED